MDKGRQGLHRLNVIFLCCVFALLVWKVNAESVTANRIADLMNRFGVVTFSSLSNTSNPWGAEPSDFSPNSVIAAWQFLTGGSSNGLKMNFREYHYASRTSIQEIWFPQVHAATGGKFSVCLGGGADVTQVPSLIGLATNSTYTAGFIEFLEGVNEPNETPIPANQTLQAQAALYAGVQGLAGTPQPPSLALPSVAVTSIPINGSQSSYYVTANNLATINGEGTYANIHLYPQTEVDLPSWGDANGTLAAFYTIFSQVYNNKPQIITEWHPTLYAQPSYISLNATWDSYWTPMFILRAYLTGFQRFYWFALFDFANEYLSGLFPRSGYDTPRQAAYVVRAMYTLTGDSGADQLTFTTGSLDYNISGLPGPISAGADNTGGQHELFQNSSGHFFLYVWNAQRNPGGSGNLATVTFNSPIQRATLYRISDSSTPSGPSTPLQSISSSSLSWTLDANVYLIVITPTSSSSAGSTPLSVLLSILYDLLASLVKYY